MEDRLTREELQAISNLLNGHHDIRGGGSWTALKQIELRAKLDRLLAQPESKEPFNEDVPGCTKHLLSDPG